MTREEAKRRAELYWALGDGKAIQVQNPVTLEWKYLDINQIDEFNEELKYRIKPEPKYRPFNTQEECWNEMLKHQPFGWVKSKDKDYFHLIGLVQFESEFEDVMITFATSENLARSSHSIYENYIFADGTPFGIKEE